MGPRLVGQDQMKAIKKIKIANRLIGEGEPCFIIAEAGTNHDGKLEQAKQLIDIAKDAGADAIKFQLFKASKIYPKSAGYADYLKTKEPIYNIIKDREIPFDWIPELVNYCKQKKIIFLSSVFDEEAADFLDPFVSAFKIASSEITHYPLIKHIASKGKPIIVSTGAANLEEIKKMISVVRSMKNNQLILMQCTASYPAPLDSMNLKVIPNLKKIFNLPVGLSDHSKDPIIAPLVAVSLGANAIEKHFTISNKLPGPDHSFAIEPDELKLMVEKIRTVEKALGSGKKQIQDFEKELHDFARRQIFAINDIAQEEVFTKENVGILRRGKLRKGLEPKFFEKVLGKHAKRFIKAETPIKETDYE